MHQEIAIRSELQFGEVDHTKLVKSFIRHMRSALGEPDQVAANLRVQFHAVLSKRMKAKKDMAWRRRHIGRFEAALAEATAHATSKLQAGDRDFSMQTRRKKATEDAGRKGGVFFRLAGDSENGFGKMIEVAINAEPLNDKGRAEFAVGYATSNGGENGLCRFKLEPGKNVYSFRCAVGKAANGRPDFADYLGIWPDTNGQGNGVLINDVVIRELNSQRYA